MPEKHIINMHVPNHGVSQSPRVIDHQVIDLATPVQLLDHRAIEWKHVTRAHYWMEQTFEYAYPGPIHELHQRLMVIPPDQHGDQQLSAFALHPSLPRATVAEETDAFGNRIIRIFIPEVDERVTFDMKLVVERDFSADHTPRLTANAAQGFLVPTHLTTPDATIEALAARFRATHQSPEALADAVNTWLYTTMRYGRGATTIHTTAAEALAIGQGLCQDYAHIMIAICRSAGIPTRYVSGHLLGEGRSHAWVEILIPDNANTYRAVAFDPTNHRRTTPAYLTIATGRDYSDVSPTSGTFIAPYPGQLHTTKRAGVTHVERQLA